jgi:hypothetical protein
MSINGLPVHAHGIPGRKLSAYLYSRTGNRSSTYSTVASLSNLLALD